MRVRPECRRVQTDMPSQEQIRTIVASVVDGVLARTGEHLASDAEASRAPKPSGEHRCIAIGADHGGYPLKERIGFYLREQGYEVRDCGTNSPDSVDYPDFAHAVARLIGDGTCSDGIIVDGAGIGSAMVANKVPGVRAALCYDVSSARNSREHNHANVLTLGAALIGNALALQIVEAWLATGWGPGRHARRVDMITDIERQYLKGDRT
ncbi:MAG: ribose 5-phosphate isomerase B [Acidimicrobiia bacterium]